ncbi:viroplasmin family protein [Vagococcus fluvialis]|uniref:ribonuclease H1 domain-containing protein n=1 Tax=Vagococcus fluvialis TaxID=2738 RepID=UPI002B2C991E|nr:ribonuclease H family protein [Vagococcus fluvialis]
MSKYYAVKNGIKPGIYTTWEDCQDNTKGYPNTLFKSFDNEEAAQAYLRDEGNNSMIIQPTKPADVQLYVDGSWNDRKSQYGWGFVLVVDEKSISSGFGKGNNSKYLKQQQIGGEVVAVLQGLDRAVYKGCKHAEIVYDYLGIEMWATGEWQAKSDIASAYVHYLKEYNNEIDISFKKVKSHSGNKFNDQADRLAKKGANK